MTPSRSFPLRIAVSLLLALQLSFAAIALRAQDQSIKPGINDNFKNPALKADEWEERFETESREVFAHRKEIVATANLKPGMTVADVGAGTGLFTMLFAEQVGKEGKVLAVDIATPFLANIQRRAKEAGRHNVTTVLGTDRDTKLPENSVDMVFICDTYHHFEFPRDTMASIHRALKPGGTIVLIDFHRIPGESSEWTLNHVRAGQEAFVKEIEEVGFELLESPKADFLKENYLVKLRKK